MFPGVQALRRCCSCSEPDWKSGGESIRSADAIARKGEIDGGEDEKTQRWSLMVVEGRGSQQRKRQDENLLWEGCPNQ